MRITVQQPSPVASVWRAASSLRALSALLCAALLCSASWAQPGPIRVDRYDDADDYLPSAQRRNSSKLRLFLQQQDGETLFKVLTPRNVTVDVVARIPDGATMGVVFLIGGTGVLSIVNDRLDRSFSFQTRTRDRWWSHRFATFLVDAPSDRLDKAGIEDPVWRAGAEHNADLQAVIQAIGERFKGPLAVHGHSNGAMSIANIARFKPPQVKAYVYSSASHYQRATTLIYDVEHPAPVLFVQHRKDACVSSRSSVFDGLEKAVKAPRKQTLWIDGGVDPFSGACGPFAAHSFVGVESETIDQTAPLLRDMLSQ